MDTTSGFEWLADLQKSQSFTTCDLTKPAKSTDFGSDGYTASITDWHELLQLTAPDETCGIAFVRGRFPNIPDAILARAQRRDDTGSKGTFGTRLLPPVDGVGLELGERRVQGLVNLRWPYTQYELKRKDGNWAYDRGGTYEEISFVKDGTVIQIIRIKWGSGSSLSDYDSTDAQEKQVVTFHTGGVVQFGCPCSNGSPPIMDTFKLNSDDGTRMSCSSEHYQKRLEMQVFVNGTRRDVSAPMQGLNYDEIAGIEVDTSATHLVELTVGDPVIIISTYALRDVHDPVDDVAIADFEGIDDYLGICSTSVNMTDRLWTALCSTNYEASEALESCVIGRCVEQILCVYGVPLAYSENDFQASLVDGDLNQATPDTRAMESEIALICNIMASQHVDVQSAFFQIRLLAKVHDFIATRHFEPDLLESIRPLDEIRDTYLIKLRAYIRSALVWLVNTDLKPGKLLLALRSDNNRFDEFQQPSARLHTCETNRVNMDFDRSYNQACFATLAVWYVMKHCPQAITDDFKSRIVLPKLDKAYESVQKRASRDKEPTQKNDVLQWFHLSCLILICSQPFGTVSDGQDGFIASGLDQHDVVRTQQKFEKYVARLKTNHNDTYSIEHEELDRLVLLGEELAFESLKTDHTASLAAARVAQTRARIAERKRTTRFNPGPKSSKGSRLTSNGPWELLCLNHLNHLLVTDESNIRASRDRLFEFMMADYSFMTSWDRSDSDMVGKWWDLEPTSVVCAALLDLKLEGKLKSAISEAAMEDLTRSIHDPSNSSPTQERNTTALEGSSQELSIKEILLQMKQANEQASRDHLVQMRQLLAQDEMGVSLALRFFDWMACKPSFPIFHPNSWSNSLDDTPEVYKVQQTKHVPLRKDILRYLESRGRPNVVTNSEFTLTNIVDKIPAEDIQFLSIFDLRLSRGFVISSTELSINGTTSLLSDDIIGRRAPIVGSQVSRSKKASNSYSSNQLELYRSRLFKVLNDSLVDMGVKYRIFFLEKCSPSLIGSFIYLWHPDALDTIDSYFGASSRFSDARERQMWTTTITISHWSIQPTSLSKEHLLRFKEHRRKGNFPPVSIATLGMGSNKSKDPDSKVGVVEERSSSLVITGDSSGHLWICSVWSSLTDVESIALPIRTLPSVLQRFIHQQACGRCLAFLILLGHFCEKLAGDYELTLSRLDGIVGLGEEVLLEGLEWGTSEAVDKLKKMLWGLEALRVFDDRLSASISQIQKAQETMERTIRGEASQQHVDLLEEYNNVIEEFEKRYGMLSDMQVRTQLKIRQVTGLRDGISAVTNVEDSQTALRDSKTTIKQGNNIRILTYITIAYLPLGFVTGLFSVGHGTFMDNAGNALFAILVVVFVVGTYGLALSLESIIDQWSRFKKQKKINKRRNNPIAQTKESEERDVNSSAVHEEDRQSKRLPLGILGSCFGLRKTDELTDGNSEEKISRFA